MSIRSRSRLSNFVCVLFLVFFVILINVDFIRNITLDFTAIDSADYGPQEIEETNLSLQSDYDVNIKNEINYKQNSLNTRWNEYELIDIPGSDKNKKIYVVNTIYLPDEQLISIFSHADSSPLHRI